MNELMRKQAGWQSWFKELEKGDFIYAPRKDILK